MEASNKGKKISLDDLINFIKHNSQIIQSIGCVDLSPTDTIISNVSDSIQILKFQDSKKINFLPKNLFSIFNPHTNMLSHTGVRISTGEPVETNTSLFSSILFCLREHFITLSVEHQNRFIKVFVDRLVKEYSVSLFTKNNYKSYGWKKYDLENDLKRGIVGKNVIKSLADFTHINIFVLDIEEDKLYYANGENYVPYKKNIFLIKYSDNTFEPIYSEKSKYFCYGDPIIQHIIESKKLVEPYNFTSKLSVEFNLVEENLEPYGLIKKIVKKNSIDEVKQQELPEPMLSKISESEQYDDTMNAYEDTASMVPQSPKKDISDTIPTMKMTLKELQNIATQNGIYLSTKYLSKYIKKTKQQLIDEIMSKKT